MAALGAHGFPVPRAVEHNRHAVLMSLVDATLLVQARSTVRQRAPYANLVQVVALQLASYICTPQALRGLSALLMLQSQGMSCEGGLPAIR